MNLDWTEVIPKKKPSKKQIALYHKWVRYLSDSRLLKDEVYRRAAFYAESGQKPPETNDTL